MKKAIKLLLFALVFGIIMMLFLAVYADDGAPTSTENGLDTEYGNIPTEYASKATYPFAIFKDGTFVGAAADWSAATHLAYSTPNGGKATLLMRADHNFSASTSPARLYMINGELTIDLGGHTLTGSNHTVFEGATDDNYTGDIVGNPTKLTVKNGTILSNNKSILVLQSSSTSNKEYDLNFEGVTFGWVNGTTRDRYFHCWDVNKGNTTASLKFNDCTFDLRNVNFSLSMFLMNSKTVDAAIRINGGEIKAKSLDSINLYQFDNSGEDSFVFGKNGDGEYTKLIMPQGVSVPRTEYTIDTGESAVFRSGVADGSSTVYSLVLSTTLRLSSVFSSGMVFQRNKNINVYGYCDTEGAEITVTLADKTKKATVSGGKWSVTFEPMAAANGLTLTVNEEGLAFPQPFVFEDVAIGEVWVISGQSNAEYETYKMEDAEEYLANADNFDNIRTFRNPKYFIYGKQEYGFGEWHKVTKETLLKDGAIEGDVSAIGYVMATMLAAELGEDVTVALVDASFAGSGIRPWIEYGVYVSEFGNDKHTASYDGCKAFYEQYGYFPYSTSEVPAYVGSHIQRVPATCYDAMISPLEGYAVAGVMWYQGETNPDMLDGYSDYFKAVMKSFNKAFGDDRLPYFVIQLAPYGAELGDFRACQYKLGEIDNVYVIGANTEGSVFNESDLAYSAAGGWDHFVHPSRKSPIGHRLFDAILKYVYSRNGETTVIAPIVEKIEADGATVTVTFDTDVKLFFGDKVEGFEISGEDGTFTAANATISGNKVILTANGVSAPKTVRYGVSNMLIETQSGAIITYDWSKANVSDKSNATIIDSNGSAHVFTAGKDQVIRTRYWGNITNASGHPMPIFKLDVGYKRK